MNVVQFFTGRDALFSVKVNFVQAQIHFFASFVHFLCTNGDKLHYRPVKVQ